MNKAVFLDRDGVINKEVHYLHRIEDCVFNDEIFEFCRVAKNFGYLLIVVTNQSGIIRKMFSVCDYFKLRDYIHSEFEKRGTPITSEYYCPHLPEVSGECECRKPNPGMILQAAKNFDIDLSKSVLVGDSGRDIEAGRRAGIGVLIALQTENVVAGDNDVYLVKNLDEATRIVCEHEGERYL